MTTLSRRYLEEVKRLGLEAYECRLAILEK